jgi:hypothetical protein
MKFLFLALAVIVLANANALRKDLVAKRIHSSHMKKHHQHDKEKKWWIFGDSEETLLKRAKDIPLETWKSLSSVGKVFAALKTLNAAKSTYGKLKLVYDATEAVVNCDNTPQARLRELGTFLNVVGAFTSVPVIGSFLKIYGQAVLSIIPAMGVIYDAAMKEDRTYGQADHPGAWPGGLDLVYSLQDACEGKAATSIRLGGDTIDWLVDENHCKQLQFTTGVNPFKGGLGITRYQRSNKDHLKKFIKDYWQDISLLHYGLTVDDTPFCICRGVNGDGQEVAFPEGCGTVLSLLRTGS